MTMRWMSNQFFVIPIIFLVGCVSLPPEAPELSAELGKRIAELEHSNITLLHRFFDQKRDELDRFIQQVWVPLFAEEFFSDPTIADVWLTIVDENDASQRLRFITELGPRLQTMINEKRLEFVKPLCLVSVGIGVNRH